MTRVRVLLAAARPVGIVIALLGLPLVAVAAQDNSPGPGARLFMEHCADCHTTAGDDRIPGVLLLSELSPRAIVAALTDGVMRDEGQDLTRDQKVALAEYLSRRAYTEEVLPESAFCADRGWAALDHGDVGWMGYGGNLEGTGFQTAARAGLSASDVPNLQLKWAFGFPDAAQVRTKPTVIGDAVLVGGPYGEVFALDAESGCVRWAYAADAAIRGAIVAAEDAEGRSVAYFVDFRTNAYALDVATGQLLWRYRVGWHATSNTTGSPAVYDGKLIVPISSWEVVTAGDPRYECCTASGAVAAVDVMTGDPVWYHRVIPDIPEEAGKNDIGTQLWAPSGAPVWASPTVDVRRGLVYIGTGENYTRPTSATSDAVLAVDLKTGVLAWSFQATDEDAFTMACTTTTNRQNCPAPAGPDLDFGMAPMLVERADGREILVVGQKSGVVWALDPDADGAMLWSTRVGKGSALGGIHWGMATDGRLAYAANSDRDAVIVDVNPERALTPGLYALDLMNGEVVWDVPSPDGCAGRQGCFAANSAAPTVIPGVVFAGGLDGVVRAHATSDGALLWEYETAHPHETVNGIPGSGGAIDGPGPVVANGTLFVNSGYGMFNQMPGNLLLAFTVGGR